jgi:hypothetical protein
VTDPAAGWLGIPGLPAPEWARDVDQFVSSAADATQWIAQLPTDVRRSMTMSVVRCAGGKVLLRLYRLPWDSPFVTGRRLFRRRFLAVPTGRATFNDGRPAKPLWVVTLRDAWVLRWRCHTAAVAASAADLMGRTAVPNANVVPSVAARRPSRRHQ